MDDPESLLRFWFGEAGPDRWFDSDTAFDTRIRERYGALHGAAVRGELAAWRDTPRGRLAEVIVLDQFSRNMFRGTAAAFASDPQALALAQEAVRSQADRELPPPQRAFLYMPYMHSESARVHQDALRLFSQPGLEGNLHAERWHKDIIDRFGRYPHRNAVLGRTTTADEQAYLDRTRLPF